MHRVEEQGMSSGIGYNPNNSLCSSFYSGIEEVVEDGGRGISRTKGWHGGGFISSFGCTKSFDEDTECMQ